MNTKNLSEINKAILQLYDRFETEEFTISIEHICTEKGKLRLNITVTDTETKEVLHDSTIATE